MLWSQRKIATFSDLHGDPKLENWDFSHSTLTVAHLLDPGATQGDNNFLQTENNVCNIYHKFYNKRKPNNMRNIYSQIWQILFIMPPASLSLKEVDGENAVYRDSDKMDELDLKDEVHVIWQQGKFKIQHSFCLSEKVL